MSQDKPEDIPSSRSVVPVRQDEWVPRLVSHVPLRWADIDSFGHVNNVVYLRYLQEARVDMLFVRARELGAERLAEGVVVASYEIAYRTPLLFRARPVRVETWVRQVTNSTVTLGYEVLDDEAEQSSGSERVVYAVASTVLVPYDMPDGRPRRITPDERAILETFVEDDGPVPQQQPEQQPDRRPA